MSRKRWVFRLSHSILLAGIIGGTHAQISIEPSVMESSIPSTFLQTTPSPIDTPLPSSAKSEPSSVPGSFSSIVDPSSLTDALSSQTRRPTSTSSTARTTITLSGNIAVHGSSKQVPVVAGALASVVLVVAAFVIVRLLFLRRKRRRAWFLSHVAGRPPDPFVPPDTNGLNSATLSPSSPSSKTTRPHIRFSDDLELGPMRLSSSRTVSTPKGSCSPLASFPTDNSSSLSSHIRPNTHSILRTHGDIPS
ncbi:hypothetical protein CC1G_08782 [Coprinopsis cinerea okayama7|uniref:Mid2 domain-containing protein n=1 Tax=Coprinopsis cinerea (strain Okayama-7 / 130 / ATCC MYA-4618 / FGSC 9003) TaxID=240176 RepID=A8N432_COPC7|nr:hypothetical protein CC1G_08782 [Coprinopsis cinerea okayama7\|eukprot:XP_001829627.2 hypothetical protein CC1G_08782 [Coprinopsis cinerea okayama7\